MRFIYSTDIHGDKAKYEKLLELALSSGTKNIVISGDLLPKNARDRKSLQKEFIHGWFKDYLRRVNDQQVRFIAILGNDDVEAVEDDYKKMIADYEYVYDVDKAKADIEDVSFIGLSSVLDTPFFRKDRIAVENEMELPAQRHNEIEVDKGTRMITAKEWEEYRDKFVPKMENLLANLPEITEGKKGIYVFHEPPYGIGLDFCKDKINIGSRAILKYIEQKQPYMSLHGHVHESSVHTGKWNEKVGNTVCMNCGQSEYGEPNLNFALIDTERNLFRRKIISCRQREIDIDDEIRDH